YREEYETEETPPDTRVLVTDGRHAWTVQRSGDRELGQWLAQAEALTLLESSAPELIRAVVVPGGI
ncbi:MAG: hypothetical protein AABX36_03910, partial [Candidatus Thermoplasmatota archaeon]